MKTGSGLAITSTPNQDNPLMEDEAVGRAARGSTCGNVPAHTEYQESAA
ncbi:MAG: hypothetical protein U0163_02030 [Gemmatimonadaceae bacterium]